MSTPERPAPGPRRALAPEDRAPALAPSSPTLRALGREAVRLVVVRLLAATARARHFLGAARRAGSRTVRCLLWTGTVALLTVSLSLAAWKALEDRELRLGGPSADGGVVLEQRSAPVDQERTLTRTVEKGVSAGPKGEADVVDPAASGRSPGADAGFVLSGKVLGLLGVGCTLAAGAAACLTILRRLTARGRSDRRQPPPLPVPDDEALAETREVEDEPGDEHAQDATTDVDGPGLAAPAEASTVLPSSPESVRVAIDGAPEIPIRSEGTPQDHPASEAAGGAVLDAVDVPRRRLETSPVGLETGSRPSLLAADGQALTIETPPAYVPGQRIFEQRKAPRVEVCFDGVLQHTTTEWSITVLDLSEDGMRVRLHEDPGGARVRPPKGLDRIRAAFSDAGRLVPVTGQVAWRRYEEGHCLMGVQFGALPPPVLEMVRAICLAEAAAAQG